MPIFGGGRGLTDAELRLTPVPVTGTVAATGGLTDAQLRAGAVAVSGAVTVSGTVTATPTGTQAVSGTFWQATQPVSAANLDVALSTRLKPADTLAAVTAVGTVTTVTTVAEVTAITNALPAGTNNIGDVDIASIIPGTGATNLGKAEDAAHTSGDVGVMMLGVRTDTRASLGGTTGDYVPPQMNSSGDMRVEVSSYGSGGHATTGVAVGVTVTNTATLILAANTARKAFILTNNGANNLYVSGTSAVTSSGAAMGLIVKPGGSYDGPPCIYDGTIYGIYEVSASSQNVSVIEYT